MFTVSPCAAGCGRPAISGSNICFVHQASQKQEVDRIVAHIAENRKITDLCISGMSFNDLDSSCRNYFGCNFREAKFGRCVFSGSLIRMSFFDFTEFSDCNFSNCDIQFVSFAGSRIIDCNFEGCELVHINFLGSHIENTSFNNSNLYNSRYINTDLSNLKFVNCNLKQVNFSQSRQTNILFKSSNTAEAIFEIEEF